MVILTMTRHQRVKSYNTRVIRGLNAPHECCVEVGCISCIAVAVGIDTRVDSSGVAGPDLEISFWHRFTGVDIDYLDIQCHGHAGLTLSIVRPDKLTRNPVRPLRCLWSEDARVVASKYNRWINVGSNTS